MSKIIQTPPLDSLTATFQPVDIMIGEVASLIGGAKDPNARERALRAIDRAADRMNMAGVFMFGQATKTYDSLTSNQSTLELPDDWGWPTHPPLVFDSDDNMIKRMEWKLWDIFKLLEIDPNQTAIPSYLSIQSEIDGLAYIYPHVDTNSAAKITVPYVKRIQRPSETEEMLIIPEVREALITGGEYFVKRFRYAKYPQIYETDRREFIRTIEGAQAAANRWMESAYPAAVPDMDGRLHTRNLAEYTNSRIAPGPSYIKVG